MDAPPSFDDIDSRLQHIRHVIREQFGSELTYKEGELEQIEDRIRLAKLMLQRLRLGVLAQHYGVAGFYPTALDFSEENVGVQSSWASFEQEFLKKQSTEEGEGEVGSKDSEAADASGENSTGKVATASSSALSTTVSLPLAPSMTVATSTMMIRGKPLQSLGEMSSHLVRDYRARKEFVLGPVPPSKKHESAVSGATTSAAVPMDTSNDVGVMKNGEIPTNQSTNATVAPPSQLAATKATSITTPSDIHAAPSPLPPPPPARDVEGGEGTRFYSKKRIIVGNTSQYLHPAASSQENMDGSTHKWMCYVRGPHQDPDISNFVKAVRFFLHPSYHPNDIIRVTRPPFHLIRLGWGEFPLRVQLEFCDRRNKPVDIIHNLVLDRTHTGQQTLGAETVVDLDINPLKELEGLAVCSGPNGLSHPLMNGHFPTNSAVNSTTSTSTTAAIAKEGEETTKISIDRNIIMPLSQQPGPGANLKVSVMNTGSGGGSVSKEAGLSDIHLSVMRTSRESSIFSIKSSEHSDSTTASYLPLSTSSTSPLVEIKPDTSAAATTNPTTTHNIIAIPPNPTLSGKIPQPQVLTTNLEKCLHSAVRMVPLYGRPSSSEDFHLTAYSVEQFKSWSIGRRRASEWMRALAVKRHVERKLKLGKSSLLSTKQVMQWCRRNGYTLLDPCVPKGVGFCKYCGCQLEVAIRGEDGKIDESAGKNGHHLRVHERCRETYENAAGGLSHCHDNDDSSLLSLIDMEGGGRGEGDENEAGGASNQKQGGESSSLTAAFRPLSTLSGSEHIFADLIETQEQIERDEATRVEDEVVDVETQPGCTSARARGYEHPIPRLRVPQTPELKWVQQTAASLGINIFPAVIDRMYAHVVEHMVYMSCTRFLKAILMQALQEAGRRVEGDLPSERVLTPLHVFQAIQSLDQCDFLTNKHLGLEAKKLNEEGGVSDDQLSSSCSSSDDEG